MIHAILILAGVVLLNRARSPDLGNIAVVLIFIGLFVGALRLVM